MKNMSGQVFHEQLANTMNKTKSVLVISFSLLALVIGYAFFTRQHEQLQIPTLSSRRGDASGSAEFLNAQKAVGYYRDEIQKKPEVVKNYVELAQLFLQEARVTGNHHEYVPKVRVLIDEALNRDPHDMTAQITKASLLMTMHRFSEAGHLAEDVVKEDPYNAFAFGVLCDAQVELGKYDDAVKTCDRMLMVRPDLRSYSRASYLRELYGDLQGAEEAMSLAANAGVWGQESRVWSLHNLANLYFQQGKLDTAEFIEKGILEERPNYAYAFSGLAKIDCARQKTDEAAALLSRAAELTPEHIFLEELADLYEATGQVEGARGTVSIVLSNFEVHEKDGWDVDREYAMFCSNHHINLEEALDRAKRAYDRRPDNIDVLDTYAWALYNNGKPEEAIPYMERALRLKTQNPILHYHAGMIYYAAQQHDEAFLQLQQMIHLNPYVNILYAQNAEKLFQSISGLASGR
jgi:tetratricopeptide (TPR) repeat protein